MSKHTPGSRDITNFQYRLFGETNWSPVYFSVYKNFAALRIELKKKLGHGEFHLISGGAA